MGIAVWREDDQEGSWGWGRRVPSRCFLPAPAWKPASGLAVQKSRSWGALKGVTFHLQGCGGEAPGSLCQPHPSDYIHVSHRIGGLNYLGVGWQSFLLGKTFAPTTLFAFFSYEWKGKIEEDSEVLMVRNISPTPQNLNSLGPRTPVPHLRS